MQPNLGPVSVHWYGIIIGLGVLLGVYLAIKECKQRGVSPDALIDLIALALPIAIISARIYYVIFEWGYFKNHLSEIPAIWHGGIAIHGGLIGAISTKVDASYIFRFQQEPLSKQQRLLAVGNLCSLNPI